MRSPINLSCWDHLRSFSMWCLGMPDCMAWGLYHSKAGRAFSSWRAKSCSVWSQGTHCDLNCDFVHLVGNDLMWTAFRGIPAGKWDLCNSALYEKDQRGSVVPQNHPWWTSSSPEVSTEEGSVWTRGDGVLWYHHFSQGSNVCGLTPAACSYIHTSPI